MRIGFGIDYHALAPGIPLVLGGVQIPSTLGCVAHSDGDVLLHALCDALLGALALGDIGQHFPNTDPQYKDKDSTYFLRSVYAKVQAEGYLLCNADTMLLLEYPALAPHIPAMRAKIATLLGAIPHQISIKATTTEGLGFIGRKEGIAAHACVLLQRA